MSDNTQNNSGLNDTQKIIAQIVANNENLNVENIEALIEATNPLKGCKFISLSGYCSDASENTELADAVINIGFIYENMKTKDTDLLAKFSDKLDTIDAAVDLYSGYHKINTGKLTLEEYKRAVKGSVQQAYSALVASNEAGPSGKTNNDFYLNKALVYNTNTNNLSILGQGISKTVVEEGEVKVTKTAPLTLAKELIKKAAGLRTDTYRRYKIANLTAVKITGETIELS